ncbi:MAG TPA: hypothetical protein VFS59_14170, partial [Gemmatimonadaceae bacterium]|nr:hypothetical protein [Gemmatimonadaceae bacterium]
ASPRVIALGSSSELGDHMSTRISRLWAVVLAVAVVSGVLAGSVYAGRLSVSETRWTIAGTAEAEDTEGGFRIRCPMTVTGSFHSRTFAKTRAAIGAVQSHTVSESACTGEGRMRFETAEFPYNVDYEAFTGTLPNIRDVRTRIYPPKVSNLYTLFPAEWCLYSFQGGTATLAYTSIEGTAVWNVTELLVAGPLGCPAQLHIQITSPMRAPGGTSISTRLI